MIEVNVLESVSHDRYHLHKGQARVALPDGVAEILKKGGFVEFDTTDLIGAPAAKMAAQVQNKMDAPAANKTIRTPKT